MNTKVEEALALLDAEVAGCGRLEPEDCENCARIKKARTTLAAHIAQQDATIARMRDALEACIDYGSMTDDGWVTDKARAALNQENANGT
jgi:hypothetical protein